ncbi:MAG TPA: hypothetical protein VF642_12525 [Propionibacteriaceae bacterium]|jgi:hypothetical protein
MILSPYAREWYRVEIATEPAVATWEASFDGGTTWEDQTLIEGLPAWLIAGTNADPGAAVAVLAGSVAPLLRAVDTPEIVVREGPKIYVQ